MSTSAAQQLRGAALFASVSALVAVGAPACDALFGIEVPAEGATFREPACAECVEAKCASDARACIDDAECAPAFACMVACPVDDPRCRADCEAAHPEVVGQPRFEAWDACRRTRCTDPCIGLTTLSPHDEPGCAACLAAEPSCREPARPCVEDARCERVLTCAADAKDPQAQTDCVFSVYPDPLAAHRAALAGEGVDPYFVWGFGPWACWRNCHDACATGTHFECSGDWAQRVLADPHTVVSISLRLSNPFSGAPPPELVEVHACSAFLADPTVVCGADDDDPAVLSSAMTDATGTALLEVPVEQSRGFDGAVHFRVTDCDQIWQPPFPISVSEPWGTDAYRSLDEVLAAAAALTPSFEYQPELAMLTLHVTDCYGDFAGGLTIEVEGGETLWSSVLYIDGGEVTNELADAVAVYGNLAPGVREVVARRDGVQVARRKVYLARGAWTHLWLGPNPREP